MPDVPTISINDAPTLTRGNKYEVPSISVSPSIPNSTQVLPHKAKPACSFRFLAYCADVMQREEEKRVKEKRGA
jgi:hypothetical protein